MCHAFPSLIRTHEAPDTFPICRVSMPTLHLFRKLTSRTSILSLKIRLTSKPAIWTCTDPLGLIRPKASHRQQLSKEHVDTTQFQGWHLWRAFAYEDYAPAPDFGSLKLSPLSPQRESLLQRPLMTHRLWLRLRASDAYCMAYVNAN